MAVLFDVDAAVEGHFHPGVAFALGGCQLGDGRSETEWREGEPVFHVLYSRGMTL